MTLSISLFLLRHLYASFDFTSDASSAGLSTLTFDSFALASIAGLTARLGEPLLLWTNEKTEYKKRMVTQLLDADNVEDTNVKEFGGGDER